MTQQDDEDRCLVIGKRPPGFQMIKGFVGTEEQQEIERWILSNFVWTKRRQGSLPPSEQYPNDAPIPTWADTLGCRMVAMGIFQSRPDHVLLRRYERGVGADPHIDREAYGPVVAGLTLGSSRVLQLTRPLRRSRLEALLLPGDLYVMTGAARYRWRHSIPARLEDTFRGVAFPRTAGFSVTWRRLPRAITGCEGRGFYLRNSEAKLRIAERTMRISRPERFSALSNSRKGLAAGEALPYHRITDFLPEQEAQEIFDQILDQQSSFCPLTGNRNFLRLPSPIEAPSAFYQRLRAILPEIQARFQINLDRPEIELYVHAYNDGTHFGRHSDDYGGGNWRRRISCVYYLHRQPPRFEGGDLVVYDASGSAFAIEPEHNSAVFFPSHLMHEVLPVTCRSKAFVDSRFGINVWIM